MAYSHFFQISFTNGKSRGYSLDGFDWTRSTLSKLLHSKQASTVEKFVEIWRTDIQQQSGSPLLSSISNTPLSVPRNSEISSRKRSAADANLLQPSSTPPTLRPVHIVLDAPTPEDSTPLDEAIEKGFIGKGNNVS